jgi:hypothetical protein
MGNGSRFPCRAGCVDPEGGRGSRGIVGCRKSRCNGVAWLRGKTQLKVRPDAEKKTSVDFKGSRSWPPRKASQGSARCDRTANRHR